MEKEEFNMKQAKGTENPNNHLVSTDNSMEMLSNEIQQASVNSCTGNGRNPSSDNHILCDILSRLPVKSLMRFKCVSTHWKSLIEVDSYLHDLHYNRSKARLCGQRLVLFITSTHSYERKSDNPVIKFSTCLPGERPQLDDARTLVLDRSNYGVPSQSVNGLVLITSGYGGGGRPAFFIYNPSTGQRSPWIETTAPSGKGERQVSCIGFGFDPKTNQHKVICISSTEKVRKKREFDFDSDFMYKDEEVEDQVCEVLVVGENTWRRIDAVPPYNMRTKDCYGEANAWGNNSVYVNGSLYWRFRYTRKGEVIVGFNFGSEKFRVILIPHSVIDPGLYKFSQTVELVEVDGHLAVLKWTDSFNIYLWILDEGGNSIKWIEHRKIKLPYTWNAKPDLCIEALPGTNLIVLGPQYPCEPDSFYYYDRSTKKFALSGIPLGDHFQLREITSLVVSLAPVHAARRSTF